jgi:hypothetical protein
MNPRTTHIGRRLAAFAGAAALTLSIGSTVAVAGGPDRQFLPAPDFFEFAAGEICAFPTRIDILLNQEYGMVFTTAAGAQYMLVDGRLTSRTTNLSTGRSVVDNISGPGRFDFGADGGATTTFLGNALVWYPGHLLRTSGRLVQVTDADGNIVSLSDPRGHVEDLCVSLA